MQPLCTWRVKAGNRLSNHTWHVASGNKCSAWLHNYNTVLSRNQRLLELLQVMHFYTVKPVLSGHSKTRPKIGFQDQLLLNAGQKYCRMLKGSILQYFGPSLSYHFVMKIFVLSIFEWPLKTCFTVSKSADKRVLIFSVSDNNLKQLGKLPPAYEFVIWSLV